jgi:hypothetical protein
MRGRMGDMGSHRIQLVRALAEIDGLLIEAETVVELSPDRDDRDTAIEMLIEFQDVKRFVEAELREA